MSWKDGLFKKIALEYDLSCIIGKGDISFSRKYDLNPRRKMKDDLSQKKKKKKIHRHMMISSNVLKKCLLKNVSAGTWSFLDYLQRWHLPPPRPPKKWYFFPGGKREREDLPQEIHWNMVFSIWYVPRPPAKKKKIKDDPIPQKCT